MAAYFVTKTGENIRHIGTPLNVNPAEVIEVQLDGDELEYVRNTLSDLPFPMGRVVQFFDEHARLIAGNWKW